MRPDQNEDAELKFKIMNGSAWLFWRSCMNPPAPRTDVKHRSYGVPPHLLP
jgi:hypothetical protein